MSHDVQNWGNLSLDSCCGYLIFQGQSLECPYFTLGSFPHVRTQLHGFFGLELIFINQFWCNLLKIAVLNHA